MKRVSLLSALAIAGGLLTASARADIPPSPRDVPPGATAVPIQVRYDSTKDVSFLHIGRDVLKSAAGNEERQSRWTPGPTRSIVAATVLSLGIAGVFLLRGKRLPQTACGLVLAIGLGAIGVEAWGNGPAPFPNRPPPAGADGLEPAAVDPNHKPFLGDAVVQIVDGNRIQLVIGTKPKPQRPFRGPPPQGPPAQSPLYGPPSGPPSPTNNAPAPNDPFDKKP